MTTKQFYDCERGEPLFATPAKRHAEYAFEQAALFAAQVAMARWGGISEGISTLAARTAWLTQAHDALQNWFEGGGFAAEDNGCAQMPGAEVQLTPPVRHPVSTPLFLRAWLTSNCDERHRI